MLQEMVNIGAKVAGNGKMFTLRTLLAATMASRETLFRHHHLCCA
jgi:hypothetical protein